MTLYLLTVTAVVFGFAAGAAIGLGFILYVAAGLDVLWWKKWNARQRESIDLDKEKP
jgi:hypothetical protein